MPGSKNKICQKGFSKSGPFLFCLRFFVVKKSPDNRRILFLYASNRDPNSQHNCNGWNNNFPKYSAVNMIRVVFFRIISAYSYYYNNYANKHDNFSELFQCQVSNFLVLCQYCFCLSNMQNLIHATCKTRNRIICQN